MATLKLTLDKRRVKKNGTYPIVFKLSVNRKTVIIPSGISVHEHEFNTETNLLLNNPQVNQNLLKLDAIYRNRFYQYLITNQEHGCANAAKCFILNKQPDEFTIFEFWVNVIKEMLEAGRDGGVKIYSQSLNTISQEINLNIPFKKLTFKDIQNLENRLYKRGMSVNGASVYLRTFRAICNKAIDMDIVNFEWYPFRKFRVKKEKTIPRVLSLNELREFFKLNLPPSHKYFVSWNLGKLIFMLRGINLRDLILLRPDCLKNNRIIYRRAKTGKLYSILLTDEIKTVLDTFTPNETLLGLITTEQINSDKKINHFKQKVKYTNKHLKCIGELIGSNQIISTYVFRYSYANIAKQKGFSKDLIAEALGHEYGNSVTGIYLEEFDLEVIDLMNQSLISAVTN